MATKGNGGGLGQDSAAKLDKKLNSLFKSIKTGVQSGVQTAVKVGKYFGSHDIGSWDS